MAELNDPLTADIRVDGLNGTGAVDPPAVVRVDAPAVEGQGEGVKREREVTAMAAHGEDGQRHEGVQAGAGERL